MLYPHLPRRRPLYTVRLTIGSRHGTSFPSCQNTKAKDVGLTVDAKVDPSLVNLWAWFPAVYGRSKKCRVERLLVI
jgi:hypothetical protein